MSRQLDLFEILKGLRATAMADPALMALLPGGFHAFQPPSGTTYPFVLCEVLESEPWDSAAAFEHVSGEIITLQMTIFSDAFPDADQILTVARELTRVFDEAKPTLNGYITVRNERVPFAGPLKNPNSDLYFWPIRYRMAVQKA